MGSGTARSTVRDSAMVSAVARMRDSFLSTMAAFAGAELPLMSRNAPARTAHEPQGAVVVNVDFVGTVVGTCSIAASMDTLRLLLTGGDPLAAAVIPEEEIDGALMEALNTAAGQILHQLKEGLDAVLTLQAPRLSEGRQRLPSMECWSCSGHLAYGDIWFGIGADYMRLDLDRLNVALRSTEERLLSALPEALIVIGRSCRVVRCNQTAEELVGRSGGRLVGLGIEQLFSDIRLYEDLQSTSGTGHRPTNLLCADGALVPVLVSGVVVEETGETICIAVDLRERQRLEQQVALSGRLEAIGQLAADVAHELHVPLQYIGANLDFIAESFSAIQDFYHEARLVANESAARTRLDALVEERDLAALWEAGPQAIAASIGGVERASRIVRNLRRVSHSEPEDRAEADLNEILESGVELSRNQWKYIADLECALARDLPPVRCSAHELIQVLINLLVNAAHAIEDGQDPDDPQPARGRITLRSFADDQMICFTVADSGCGIPEAIRERIFDPFFTTKGVGRGTGQGLALVHDIIVERHGGEIAIDSSPGQGATIRICLPTSDDAVTE